jgi:DNA-binding transcriptional regulator LsrR (DeoR family)
MIPNDEKIRRLVSVAQMYYDQNLNQSDIADRIGVSRPMVSKLLTEARELGIVTITIKQVLDAHQMLSEQVKERFGLRDIVIVREQRLEAETNMEIASAAVRLAMESSRDPKLIGVGWGSMIGKMADHLESSKTSLQCKGEVFPLIGGINASYRSYHTNELVRIFADRAGLTASYLYMPAIFDSEAECKMFENTEFYHAIREKWAHIDTAILNISNIRLPPTLQRRIALATVLQKAVR